MSTKTQPSCDIPDKDRRILIARRDLYNSGNSISLSIPSDVFENTLFNVGDHVNLFSIVKNGHREMVATADTRKYYEAGAISRGNRKIRESTHGTVLIGIPAEALVKDFGYDTIDDANGAQVAITIDPKTRDLFFEFRDENDED